MYTTLIARLGGEIAIKGKNRSQFEKTLMENMRQFVRHIEGVKVSRTDGRIEVKLNGADMDEVIGELRQVMGLSSISPVAEAELDMERIKETALRVVQDALEKRSTPVTFKVDSRRANKMFPLQSPEITKEVGHYVLSRTDRQLKVDVHNPELTLTVEVRDTKAYLYCDVIPGPAGLPVGTSGKVMLLLSGGIDSPVAGWMALKRGAKLEAIHFHSFPFTSERAQEKVNELARILSRHGGRVVLHNVYFTNIQKAINQHCPEEYSITIMRRFMMRIADRLAHDRKALALVTGESLGQVASQTLESMYTINNVTNIPILRPLVAMDKTDIMRVARNIGTYETSIQPFEDCCTIFLPKNPKTKPKLDEAIRAEEKLDIEALIAEAIEKTERLVFLRDDGF